MPGSALDTKAQRHVFCPFRERQMGDPSTNTALQTQCELTEEGTRYKTVEYYDLCGGSWLGKSSEKVIWKGLKDGNNDSGCNGGDGDGGGGGASSNGGSAIRTVPPNNHKRYFPPPPSHFLT